MSYIKQCCDQVWLKAYRETILSINEKLTESKFRYFEKYIIQLDGYFYISVSGQQHTGLETKTSYTSPGAMVHVIHVLFVVFTVFENLKSSFSQDNIPVHAKDVFIKNAIKMV